MVALAVTDLLWKCVGKPVTLGKPGTDGTFPGPHAETGSCLRSGNVPSVPGFPTCASVVIPNWNGKELIEKYLPSVIAALAGDSGNEIIVVDNGSTDGSAEFVAKAFPSVR
ncbi:MAG: glycosyltransferase, partial [Acidobacteriia bacterium]|nr:glycosyltransferase [Terriglobia bacterium]